MLDPNGWPFAGITGCYQGQDSKAYALYDEVEDLLIYTPTGVLRARRMQNYVAATCPPRVYWRPCPNTCPINPYVLCAECSAPVYDTNYLCKDCR